MDATCNDFEEKDILKSIRSKGKAAIANCQTLLSPKSIKNINNTDIVVWINDLHKALDDDHEVGIQINHLGKDVIFYIDHIAHKNHSMIYFKGKTESGKLVHFVKHSSDLNMQLVPLKRRISDRLKTPFGFADWEEHEKQRANSYLD